MSCRRCVTYKTPTADREDLDRQEAPPLGSRRSAREPVGEDQRADHAEAEGRAVVDEGREGRGYGAPDQEATRRPPEVAQEDVQGEGQEEDQQHVWPNDLRERDRSGRQGEQEARRQPGEPAARTPAGHLASNQNEDVHRGAATHERQRAQPCEVRADHPHPPKDQEVEGRVGSSEGFRPKRGEAPLREHGVVRALVRVEPPPEEAGEAQREGEAHDCHGDRRPASGREPVGVLAHRTRLDHYSSSSGGPAQRRSSTSPEASVRSSRESTSSRRVASTRN